MGVGANFDDIFELTSAFENGREVALDLISDAIRAGATTAEVKLKDCLRKNYPDSDVSVKSEESASVESKAIVVEVNVKKQERFRNQLETMLFGLTVQPHPIGVRSKKVMVIPVDTKKRPKKKKKPGRVKLKRKKKGLLKRLAARAKKLFKKRKAKRPSTRPKAKKAIEIGRIAKSGQHAGKRVIFTTKVDHPGYKGRKCGDLAFRAGQQVVGRRIVKTISLLQKRLLG